MKLRVYVFCICFCSAPTNLVLFNNKIFYTEGTIVSIVCRTFNERPAFQGAVVWKNSNGDTVGNITSQFTTATDLAGLYTCSVPSVPAIRAKAHEVVIHCK